MANDDFGPVVPVHSAEFGEVVPVAQHQASQPSAIDAAGRGLAQGGTLGFGDEISGLIQALGAKIQGDTHSVGDLYRLNRDTFRREDSNAQKAHPLAYGTGELAGGLAVPAPGATEAKGLAGALKIGAKLGAAYGLGNSNSDLTQGEVGGAALDTVRGGLGGMAGGALGYGATKAIGAAGRGFGTIMRGAVQPTEAAQQLLDNGVTLTLGQMNRGGFFSKLEEAGQHSALGGAGIRDAQQAARVGLQDAALNRTRPISGALGPGDQADKLGRILDEFETAYGSAKGHQIQALAQTGQNALAPVDKALQSIADDPSIYATDAERDAARKWLANQTTPEQLGLKNVPSNGSPPLVDSGSLLKLRSNIRAELRKAAAKGDDVKAAILGKAEEAVTGGLEQQLPAPVMQELKQTDSKYREFKQVADAIARSGDQPGGFTPSHLSSSAKSGSNKMSYALGGGGPQRDLAAAGKEVLDPHQPMTGAKLLTLPLGLNHGAAPLARLANYEPVQAALTGQTAIQQAVLRSRPFAGAATLAQMLDRAAPHAARVGALLDILANQSSGAQR